MTYWCFLSSHTYSVSDTKLKLLSHFPEAYTDMNIQEWCLNCTRETAAISTVGEKVSLYVDEHGLLVSWSIYFMFCLVF